MSEQFDRMVNATKRTVPGPGADKVGNPADPTPIKFKAIPNVPTERLHRSLEFYHGKVHTAEGLHEHDDTRRSLIETGLRTRAIATELHLRGEAPGSCTNCWGHIQTS